MSFTSVIAFQVQPGKEAQFESAFARCGMLERPNAVEGFVKADLIRSVDDPAAYFVVGEWATEQAYAQWQSISRDGADPAALADLHATILEFQPGRLYRTVLASG